MRFLGLLFFAAPLGLVACAGSMRNADQDWSVEVQDDKPHKYRDVQVLDPTPIEKQDVHPAFVGVRHDLMLSEHAREARCSCLAVEIGQPGDPMFFWQGDKPLIGPDATVVAIGAQGITCAGGDPVEARRRPSISAIDIDGADVVIEVEDLPLGRPLASGAVVPKPGAGGSFYIRPRNGKEIYGRGPAGSRCKVR